ncbi:PHP domain-containing protein [Candidatus Magnetaquicoccus inordinatus]|uniref:PHP domain-containing protein n=1 Tax=Candidatus Magnetaquicoccus inordinatus TaxID=2496818 RepID=UPI00102B227C|nr:PHP domain-containing protein [Candidatus Magnetaquicoccus inordinatus]
MKKKLPPDQLFVAAASLQSQPMPPWEYHVHSQYSDGSATLSNLIARAKELGLSRLIFTEHTEPGLVAGEDWFQQYIKEGVRLRRLHHLLAIHPHKKQTAPHLEIFFGVEVPVTDFSGGLLMDAQIAEQAEFILGAVHAYPGYGWTMGQIAPELAIELEFKGLMALAENPLVDAIAHPGGICEKFATPFPLALFEEVVCKATNNGIAIELNPAYHEPMAPYLAICRKHNAWISPGSNAHHPNDMGRAIQVLNELGSSTPTPRSLNRKKR